MWGPFLTFPFFRRLISQPSASLRGLPPPHPELVGLRPPVSPCHIGWLANHWHWFYASFLEWPINWHLVALVLDVVFWMANQLALVAFGSRRRLLNGPSIGMGLHLLVFGSRRRPLKGQSIGIGLHLVAFGSRRRALNGQSIGIGCIWLHLVQDVVWWMADQLAFGCIGSRRRLLNGQSICIWLHLVQDVVCL